MSDPRRSMLDAERRERRARHAEWAVALLGLLLVVATLSYLVWRGTQPTLPPSIAFAVDYVADQPHGYTLHFTATNHGSRAVADLQIVAERTTAAGTEVLAEVTLAWLPGGSSRRGALLLADDPRRHPVELRAVGFSEP